MNPEFNFQPGDLLADKYVVVDYLGGGWEGEVYLIKERKTNIERAAKIFYPKRNLKGKTSSNYARKLHKLRTCNVLIQYHNIEEVEFKGKAVSIFISEFVEGEQLLEYQKRFRGKCLPVYQGLHLLHALTEGIEEMHKLGEYHGDIHSENIMIKRLNLRFELKLLDLFNLGKSNKENIQNDIIDVIKVFYEVIGGRKKYAKQPPIVKEICCGLKRTLILKKFKNASQLKAFLEAKDWN